MQPISIKTHYSAPELAEMELKDFPATSQSINRKAKTEGWSCRKRDKRKGLEYSLNSLPVKVQNEIREKHLQSLIATEPVKTKKNR